MTVDQVLASLKNIHHLSSSVPLRLYLSSSWLPLCGTDLVGSLPVDALSILTVRIALLGGAMPAVGTMPEPPLSISERLDYLVLLLVNLPGTIPTESKVYRPERYEPDAEWVENIGSWKGALNRQLEVVFGPRQTPRGEPRVIAFEEQGPGLVAVADCLRRALVSESDPEDADTLLEKWVDDLTGGAIMAYTLAGQEPPTAKRRSRLTAKALARKHDDSGDEQHPSKRARHLRRNGDVSDSGSNDDEHSSDGERSSSGAGKPQRANYPFHELEDIPEPEHTKGRKPSPLLMKLSILCRPRGNTDTTKQRHRCSAPGCEQSWAGNRQSSRIMNHAMNECNFITASLRDEVIAASSSKSLAVAVSTPAQPSTSTSLSQVPRPFESFSRAGEEKRRAAILHAILSFFCAALIPPVVADLPEWKHLFVVLESRVKPVCSTTISDIQLVHESAHALEQSVEHLRTLHNLTLTLDGGTTRAPTSLYTFHVTTPKFRDSHLILGLEDSGESHTAEWVRTAILDVMRSIGIERFAAIVTDRAGNVRLGRDEVAQAYPTILSLNDPPHGLNSTIKDLCKLKHFEKVIAQLRKLLSYFKKSSFATHHLRIARIEFGVHRGLERIGKTRFASIGRSAASVLRNIEPLKKIVREDKLLTSNKQRSAGYAFLRNASHAGVFELELRQLVAIITPLAKALKCLESSQSTLADVYLFWLAAMATLADLFCKHDDELGLTDDLISDVRRVVNKRFNELVEGNPIYKAALFLHPGYITTSVLRKKQPNPLSTVTVIRARRAQGPSHPDDDLRAKFPFYVDVGSFLGGLLKTHVKANFPPVFDDYASATDVASAFRDQLRAYARREPPFNITAPSPLEYWRHLAKVKDARLLAPFEILGVKLFSILPNDMPEERTMSVVTKIDSPSRATMKPTTLVNFVRVKQHNDRENATFKTPPSVLRFRDLAAHIQAEVVPPCARSKPSAGPAHDEPPARATVPGSSVATAVASVSTSTAGSSPAAATAGPSSSPVDPSSTTTSTASPAPASSDRDATMNSDATDEVIAVLAQLQDEDVDTAGGDDPTAGSHFQTGGDVDLESPMLLDLLSDVPLKGATFKAAGKVAAAQKKRTEALNVDGVDFSL
ncbi:hypothetical protein AURDEDRAFT_177535 [Auricularia subglabra TFB-10046 SS5]|uniref:Uncharacterized protein n=1 Tax=Auricularia subglabra (strain TFB-10046 / SS5) TaxID=717982 RepID=J0D3W4_AURST|nr:hypothetical protein AURDEDRAFT_177535 [Auricularia subglabra TFB-10046 SS5]